MSGDLTLEVRVDSFWKPIRRGIALLVVAACLLMPGSAGARWSEPFWIATPDENPYLPELAVNDRGDAVAAWTGPHNSVVVAERFAGGPFGAPHEIGVGRIPHVALNNSGDAVVAWTASGAVTAARRPDGGQFGEPQVLTEPGRQVDYGVTGWDVQVADNGDAVVVWWDQTVDQPLSGYSTEDVVKASWLGDDGAFAPPKPVTGPRYSSGGLDTAIDAHGRLTVVWDGSKPGVKARSFVFGVNGTRTGGFGPVNQISDNEGCILNVSGGVTSIAANKKGDALVGWREGDMPFGEQHCGTGGVVTAYRSAGAGFGASRHLSPERDMPNGFRPAASGAALAVDEKGNALADWYDGRDAVAYRSVETGTWGPLRRIAPEHHIDGTELSGGTVGLDHTGREVFLWTGGLGEYGPSPILGTRRQADGEAERTESLAPPGSQNFSAVLGFDKLGGGIAIWSSSDNATKHTSSYDTPHGLRVSFYDDAPPELSDLELVDAPAAARLTTASVKRALRFRLSERGRVRIAVKRSTSCKRTHGHLACRFKNVASAVRAAKRGRNTVELSDAWLAKVRGAKRARVRVLPRDGIGQRGHARQITFQSE